MAKLLREAAPLGGSPPADPIGGILRAFEDRYNRGQLRPPEEDDVPDLPAGEIGNAPLEDFADPQSAIASILGQMQGAADRSNPEPIDTIKHANRPVVTRKFDNIDDLLRLLLSQR